jgi:hypothetical protein
MTSRNLIAAARAWFGRTASSPAATPAVPESAPDDDQSDLPRSVAEAILSAQAHEREPDDEGSRTVVHCAGRMWLDGSAEPAEELKKAFPGKLTPTQAEVGARFLKQTLRQRRRMQQRSRPNWVTESCRSPWGE